MPARSSEEIRKVTTELSEELLNEQLGWQADPTYISYPHPDDRQPTWRLRFDLTYDSSVSGGVDLNDEVILGRGQEVPGFMALFESVDAEQLGVSRHHATLRPTESKLYLIDLGSTNGTWINGHSIGVNIPYSLSNGDVVRMGRLEYVIYLLERPESAQKSTQKAELTTILSAAAREITSQLELPEVLNQTLTSAMTYTAADEVSIWLVDEQSGELILEAGHGLDSENVNRLPVADTLAGQVIRSGSVVNLHRQKDEEQIKIKTGYLVEAVIYVPLTLGGATFGVLSAALQQPGKMFSQNDEKVLIAIGDFTAVAVHNARQFQATTKTLAHRTKTLTAMHYALGTNFKTLVNAVIGYTGLLLFDGSLSDDMRDIATIMVENGDDMVNLIHQMGEVTGLMVELDIQQSPIDLVDIASRAVNDNQEFAQKRSITLEYEVLGKPYLARGDENYLYRSIFNLVDNAIRYSPPAANVSVAVIFERQEIFIRVSDTGPGIPDNELPYLFERYARTTRSGGIGLGLELVRSAIEAHRGTIQVRNLESGGAEFKITLPGTLWSD